MTIPPRARLSYESMKFVLVTKRRSSHVEIYRQEMTVTLSFFIEPNPSARGSTSKYHYPSHRLRFDVKRSLESTDDFIARVNAAAEQPNDAAAPKDPHVVVN